MKLENKYSSFILSPEAFNDLEHIQDYIALDNPDIASRIITEIFDVFDMLENKSTYWA